VIVSSSESETCNPARETGKGRAVRDYRF
jgi:hypothetical protein